jgi:hypothetical protein
MYAKIVCFIQNIFLAVNAAGSAFKITQRSHRYLE